jgi:hypothetical protein
MAILTMDHRTLSSVEPLLTALRDDRALAWTGWHLNQKENSPSAARLGCFSINPSDQVQDGQGAVRLS